MSIDHSSPRSFTSLATNVDLYVDKVLNLMHTPLAVITKAAAILSDDVFIDMMPVAWELLIETDQELAAAAGIPSVLSII